MSSRRTRMLQLFPLEGEEENNHISDGFVNHGNKLFSLAEIEDNEVKLSVGRYESDAGNFALRPIRETLSFNEKDFKLLLDNVEKIEGAFIAGKTATDHGWGSASLIFKLSNGGRIEMAFVDLTSSSCCEIHQGRTSLGVLILHSEERKKHILCYEQGLDFLRSILSFHLEKYNELKETLRLEREEMVLAERNWVD